MMFSDLFEENLAEMNAMISYGNKKGWKADEPIDIWDKRYREIANSPK